MPETIYKSPRVTKAFTKKCFKFVLKKGNQTFAIQFMLILLLVEANTISEKRYCKKNMVGFFYFNISKMVFILLIEIVANHVVITFINIK